MLKRIFELFEKKKLEKGQGVVEYALILGFVSILAVYLVEGSDIITSIKTLLLDLKAQIENVRL